MSEVNKIVKVKKPISRDTRQNIIIVLALVALMLVFGVMSPYFLKPSNLIALLAAAVPLGLIGIGECGCLLTGAFDMSVGMVASLAGIIWTMLITQFGVPTYLAFATALLFAPSSRSSPRRSWATSSPSPAALPIRLLPKWTS